MQTLLLHAHALCLNPAKRVWKSCGNNREPAFGCEQHEIHLQADAAKTHPELISQFINGCTVNHQKHSFAMETLAQPAPKNRASEWVLLEGRKRMSLQARPLGGVVAAARGSEALLSALPKSLRIPPARCQPCKMLPSFFAKLSCTQTARLTSPKRRVPPVPSSLELQLEQRRKWRGRCKLPPSGPWALRSSPHHGQRERTKRFCSSPCLRSICCFITEGLEYTKCLIRKKKETEEGERGGKKKATIKKKQTESAGRAKDCKQSSSRNGTREAARAADTPRLLQSQAIGCLARSLSAPHLGKPRPQGPGSWFARCVAGLCSSRATCGATARCDPCSSWLLARPPGTLSVF